MPGKKTWKGKKWTYKSKITFLKKKQNAEEPQKVVKIQRKVERNCFGKSPEKKFSKNPWKPNRKKWPIEIKSSKPPQTDETKMKNLKRKRKKIEKLAENPWILTKTD